MPRGRVHELKYLIEIPIPYVDKHGRKLDDRRRSPWRRQLEVLLTDCFGAFTPGKAPALLVVRMGEDLNQADVFILAYPSDSLLIELVDEDLKHP